mgnify:CR=1 FL=1
MPTEHRFRLIHGEYVCQADDCDFSTTLNWAAESHFEEHGGELENPDTPEELR